MGASPAIDVAIGLALMYLGLSLFCTVINEYLATLIGLRSKTLLIGIQQLVDDPILRNEFYNHGLIGSKQAISISGSPSIQAHSSYIPGQVFAMALLGSLDPTKPVPGFRDIEGAIKHLPDSNIRDVLLAHVATVDQDLTKLRDNVATWYDQSMDRLGGVYKRKLKIISFIVGLVAAAATNADTLTIANALWHDSALRNQVVKIASQTSAVHLSVPEGSDGTSSMTKGSQDLLQIAEQALQPFPLGWHVNKSYQDLWGWKGVLKLLGILLTAVALALGAPFWFDLLSKFIHLRGTGDKPSRTETS